MAAQVRVLDEAPDVPAPLHFSVTRQHSDDQWEKVLHFRSRAWRAALPSCLADANPAGSCPVESESRDSAGVVTGKVRCLPGEI